MKGRGGGGDLKRGELAGDLVPDKSLGCAEAFIGPQGLVHSAADDGAQSGVGSAEGAFEGTGTAPAAFLDAGYRYRNRGSSIYKSSGSRNPCLLGAEYLLTVKQEERFRTLVVKDDLCDCGNLELANVDRASIHSLGKGSNFTRTAHAV
ncbi:hypothetical protein ES703_62820 [subsurface metagenome]